MAKKRIEILTEVDKINLESNINKKADKATVDSQLDKKVDKVSGKGLSTNDFTNANKKSLETDIPNKIDILNGSGTLKEKANKVDLESHKAEDATQAHLPKNVGLGNVDNIKQMPISDGRLENYREKLVTLGSANGSINLKSGNVFQHTPSANITYSISNAVNGQAHSFTLIINMGSTVRTLTFPASVKWQGGEIPDMSTANKTYVLTFMSVNGGGNWLGMFGGEF